MPKSCTRDSFGGRSANGIASGVANERARQLTLVDRSADEQFLFDEILETESGKQFFLGVAHNDANTLGALFRTTKGDAARFGTTTASLIELSESASGRIRLRTCQWLGARTTCLMTSPLLRALWNVPEHLQSYSTGPAIPQAEHGPISKLTTLSLPLVNLMGFWHTNLSGPWYVRLLAFVLALLLVSACGASEGNAACRARPETSARIPRPDAGEEY